MLDLTTEIEQALDVILKIEKQPFIKRKLLDKGKAVYLQVVLFKIPFGAPRKRKFLKLRHSLYGDEPEICLFVPNRKTGVDYKKTTDELIDFCVNYYTSLLEKHKVKGITTVMPLKQLKSEYGTYELRRKLVHRFDLFLCKNSLLYNPRFLTSLGKVFRIANKLPLGVPFPKDVDYDPDFQKNIEKAILTSSFYISRFSDNYSIPFGCLSNTKVELKENLETVLQQIFKEEIIPGGLKNIRALYLLPSQSKPVPLFINSELPTDMKRPHLKGKRKKLRGIEGELSSQPYKKVFVMPNGEVFVTKIGKKRAKIQPEVAYSEDEEPFEDESDIDDNNEGKKIKNLKFNIKITGNEEESESEDDKAIEEKEARLLELKEEVKMNKKQKLTADANATEKNSKKAGFKKTKVNKTKRKVLIKQNKFIAKEKTKQDSKNSVSFGNKKLKNIEEKDNEKEKDDMKNHVKMNKKQKLTVNKSTTEKSSKKAGFKKTKVNKTKRKMLIKQNKFNTKEKTKQESKKF